jgi:uncharacterized protein
MIHPSTELRHVSDTIGYGVFATAFIPEGTIVYVKDCLEYSISEADYSQHIPEMQDIIEKYSYIDENGNRILSWDIGKYVNHCCNCNTMSTGYGFEIAIRDIHPGEEITDEYGIFNLESEMYLSCKHGICRGVVHPSDFDKYYPKWDKILKKSLDQVMEVTQPLMVFLDKDTQKQLHNYLKDPSTYKSVYNLRFKKLVAANIASR